MSRTPFIAGNWKMNKTIAEAEAFIQALLPRVSTADGVDVAVCVPFTDLQAVVDSTRGSRVEVYAQNMHQAPSGAFTGEISAPMLTELDVHGVVLGHSERREFFNETDRALSEKVPAALDAGLKAILCVGETEDEREAGDTERKLRHQVQEGLEKLDSPRLGDVVIAYEPIWAIGTGLVATPEQAQDAIAFVRALVADRDRDQAERTRILYGGSVKPDNAAELLALPDVDGALVGGASLEVADFVGHRRSGAAVTVPSVCLVVLDGWGIAPHGPGNAVSLATTPVFDELWQRYPHSQLTTWGTAVGLPERQMGNSEVGHLNLGAGAAVKQDLTRIDEAVEDGTLAHNDVLRAAVRDAPRVHLIGLVSDGGVHSGWSHLEALIAMASEAADDVVVHAFTDGRDTLPDSGAGFLEQVQQWCENASDPPRARVGSVVGRYWAMDRDKRWERTQKAYDLLVHGRAEYHADSGVEAVRAAYERDETDEFIEPTTVGEEACIRPGDSVIAFNFRPDRMREITRALAEPDFDEVDRGGVGRIERYATLTEYEEGWPYPVAFPPAHPETTLPHVIAAAGGRQLHVAETEKYPHVTYFFGGGAETPEEGERRELVPSPRDVPTYDKKPEMSAREAARAFVQAWEEEDFRFGIINFANSDMVGHTGVIPAAVKAVETVDACLGEIVRAVQASGGALIITADHGNSDAMLEPGGAPNTAHSLNQVPVIVTVDGVTLRARRGTGRRRADRARAARHRSAGGDDRPVAARELVTH